MGFQPILKTQLSKLNMKMEAVKKVPEKKKNASKRKYLEAFSFFGTIFV